MTSSLPDDAAPVSLREAFWTWCRVALLSFGGPAGQIAVMHRILVDEKKWIREEQFLHALNYCMLLPGPEAQQLATYIGWLMHRTKGGLMAGTLFVLPGFLSILVLSLLYVTYRDSTLVAGIFLGLKPAVLVIVAQAVVRIGQRILKRRALVALAAAAFVAVFFFAIPFPVIILVAALVGWLLAKLDLMAPIASGHGGKEMDGAPLRAKLAARSWWGSARILALGLVLWFGPLGLIMALAGPKNVFVDQHLFFSKAAVVTFGGAYSVLTYVAQQGVEHYHWTTPGEMLDGLALAETTPGPLIMVVEFVAFLGAHRQAEGISPLLAGTLGAILTTWVTFVPCFLWVFLGAPYIEELRKNQSLSAALTGITAAVVGVVLNLAVWFGVQMLFGTVRDFQFGPLRLLAPDVTTAVPLAWLIAGVAALLLFKFKRSLFEVLGVALVMGMMATAWN